MLFIVVCVFLCMKRRNDVKEIGLERIRTLFKEAERGFKIDFRRSDRYVGMALRIAAKCGVRIPKEFRRRYCRKCKKYLVSGVNARFRTRNGKLVIYCFGCKNYRRILLKAKI